MTFGEELKESEVLEEDEYIQAEYGDPDWKLRKIMDMTGWNQQKMAEILKVSQPQISQYLAKEKKRRSEMSTHVEEKLSMLYSRIKGGLIFRGFTKSGGKCRLEEIGGGISRTFQNLNEKEAQAVKKASLVADPLNGGNWAKAEKILRDAGFEIYYE